MQVGQSITLADIVVAFELLPFYHAVRSIQSFCDCVLYHATKQLTARDSIVSCVVYGWHVVAVSLCNERRFGRWLWAMVDVICAIVAYVGLGICIQLYCCMRILIAVTHISCVAVTQ